MQVITRHQPQRRDEFIETAASYLAAVSQCAGYVSGELLRSLDHDLSFLVVTKWESAGAYRRSMSDFDTRVLAMTLMASAADDDTSFETVVSATDGRAHHHVSDRAMDAHWNGPLKN